MQNYRAVLLLTLLGELLNTLQMNSESVHCAHSLLSPQRCAKFVSSISRRCALETQLLYVGDRRRRANFDDDQARASTLTGRHCIVKTGAHKAQP